MLSHTHAFSHPYRSIRMFVHPSCRAPNRATLQPSVCSSKHRVTCPSMRLLIHESVVVFVRRSLSSVWLFFCLFHPSVCLAVPPCLVRQPWCRRVKTMMRWLILKIFCPGARRHIRPSVNPPAQPLMFDRPFARPSGPLPVRPCPSEFLSIRLSFCLSV